jgi:hypothetical protein
VIQVNDLTVAVATPQPLKLSQAPIWAPPEVVGVYALGPVDVLTVGVQFQLPVFANAQQHSVEGFQLRVEFDTNVIHVAAVEPSGLFQYAAQIAQCTVQNLLSHTLQLHPCVGFAACLTQLSLLAHITEFKSCCCRLDQQTQVVIDNQLGSVSILGEGRNATAEASDEYFTGTAVHLVTLICTVSHSASDLPQDGSVVLLPDVLQIGSAVDPVRISSATSNGDDVSTQQDTAEVHY